MLYFNHVLCKHIKGIEMSSNELLPQLKTHSIAGNLMLRLLKSQSKSISVAVEAGSSRIDGYTIRQAFDEGTEGVRSSTAMCKRVINFSKYLASKEEHAQFFGSNLLGVHRIKFFDTDRDRWFDEVLQIDEDYLRDHIERVGYFGDDWKVASDAFNLSVIWFIHRTYKDVGFTNKIAREAIIEALVVLQFRFITSAYSNFFDKPVDMEAAVAVYNELSMKFAIKRLGNWRDTFVERAEAFIDKKNDKSHYKDFVEFNSDKGISYIATDMSTRIRKMIKDQYAILDKVRSGNLRVESSSNVLTIDGDTITKDHVNAYNTSKHYLLDVAGNETSFIKRELVSVVLDLMPTVSSAAFNDVLLSIARTPNGKQRDEIESIMEDTLMHAFDYISKNRIKFNDAVFILLKMKALYTSPKTKEKRLLDLRNRIEKYAKKHTHLSASSALAAVRTAVMLYFLLRALSSNIYI